MSLLLIIILLLWFSLATSIIANIADAANQLPWYKQVIICVIVFSGAPCMLVAQIIDIILEYFLPERWDDDDDDKFGY